MHINYIKNDIENAERNIGNCHHYRWPLTFFTYMYDVSFDFFTSSLVFLPS